MAKLSLPKTEEYLLLNDQETFFLKIEEPRQQARLSISAVNGFAISFGLKLLPYTGDEFTLLATENDDVRLGISYKELAVLYREGGGALKPLCALELGGAGPGSFSNLLDGEVHQVALSYSEIQKSVKLWIDSALVLEHASPQALFNCDSKGCNLELLLFKSPSKKNLKLELHALDVYHSEKDFGQRFKDKKVNSQYFKGTVNPELLMTEDIPVVEQFKNFPLPRYKKGHTLKPNFNWADPSYYGSEIHGRSKKEAIAISTQIQKELATKWNYSILLPNIRLASTDNFDKDESYLLDAVRLANANPQLPVSAITLWAQIDHRLTEHKHRGAIINRNDLSSNNYLRDSQGNFIDHLGKKDKKSLSPLADQTFAIEDGKLQAFYVKNLLGYLMRPIDFINENGEVPPHLYLNQHLEKDPRLVRAVQSSGLSLDEWRSEIKTQFREAYLNPIQDLKQLKNVHFSWYNNAQGSIYFYEWKRARQVMTPINGSYYATPSFYPKRPANWKYWSGPWHGWQWIDDCRQNELLLGDRFFSPFVSPGWSPRQEENIRPGQWLGLLKCLGTAGAEFYYTGFFNVGESQKADPKVYIWQLAMPSLAQAVFSNCETLFREARFLQKDNSFIISYPNSRTDVLLVVRKLKNAEQYLIGANLNGVSNSSGHVTDNASINFFIGENEFTLPVRVQGSVFGLDLSTTNPKIVQFDGWHENKHPWFWSKDIKIEAELSSKNWDKIGTELANAQNLNDLTGFRSFLKLRESELVIFDLPLRDKGKKSLFMNYRGKAKIRIEIGDKKMEFDLLSENFSEQKIEGPLISADNDTKLKIIVVDGKLDLDSIRFSSEP